MVTTTYPTESLHSYTLDWTERYGSLPAGTYRVEKDVEICYLGKENESYAFSRRVSAPFKIDASMPGVGQDALPADALTIDDLLRLSEKGENLNWEDFEGFPYEETGFGQQIRSYPMAAPFSFQITADPLDRNIPQSFRLLCQVEDVGIDIREDRESLDTFLLVHSRDLLPGQTNHWDIKLEVTSPETTGAAYFLSRGTIPPEA